MLQFFIPSSLDHLNLAILSVARQLNSLHITWFLGSTASLMVQGIDIIPHDIDILVPSRHIPTILRHFSSLKFTQNSVDVEIVPYDQPAKIRLIDFHGVSIPVDSLANLLAYYRRVPGKEAVVYLIEAAIS